MAKHSASLRSPMPDAPAVLSLQGKLYRGYGDTIAAVRCFEEAIRLNPLMWDAFTALCDLGANVNITSTFKSADVMAQIFDQGATLMPKDSANNLVQNKLEAPSRKALTPSSVNGNDTSGHFQTARTGVGEQNGRPVPSTPETSLNSTTVTSISGIRKTERGGLTLPPLKFAGRIVPPHPSLGSGIVGERPRPSALGWRSIEAVSPLASRSDGTWKFRMRRAQQGRGLNSEPGRRMATPQTFIPERKRTLSARVVPSRFPPRSEQTLPQGQEAVRSESRDAALSPANEANMMLPDSSPITMREAKRARRPSMPGGPNDEPGITRLDYRSVSGGSRIQPIYSGSASSPSNEGQASGTRRATTPPKHGESRTGPRANFALKTVLNLLETMATGYYLLSKFDCGGALTAFERLPRIHRETPWVLAQIGRSHFERAAYVEADRCAMGNAWARSQEHEQALKCFKRATQMDPNMAYAYTLQGHEYVASEDYDRALRAYRRALSIDKRHYNAYYGIGRVYERFGNLDRAYTQYRAAADINPTNAVLACCIGSVMEKQNRMARSLQYYTQAIGLSPRSVQPRFRRARVLIARGDYVAAREELLILRDLAPDEAMVHFLLGSLYKLMNEKRLALRHFTFALGLDPRLQRKSKTPSRAWETDRIYRLRHQPIPSLRE
ncbi:hypothetical protein jhhlp_004618 [Lomentospora prolificans]|uniref:Uncharacterized protein n=1 Tax=Lomentospora prolificans TaxID=41688 RepID=A0A2N3NC21_9PEZI|nr:hypothetical protein jhhlp_004618 [Lomentospora prolificans]